MKNRIVKVLAIASTLASVTAHAQTYNVDITMTGIEPTPTTFTGSFTFDRTATGACSAAFCAHGVTPEFTKVNVGDPVSGGAFSDVLAGPSSLSLYDTYYGIAGQSSFVYSVSFNLASALGSGQSSIGISNVVFQTAPNVTGIYACNGGSVTCTTATLSIAPTATAAPEMDAASASAGLVLLFGAVAVLCGRRRLDVARSVGA